MSVLAVEHFADPVTWQTQQLAQQGYSQNVIAAVAATVQAVGGVQCSPITVIGAASGCQANQQAVCCTGDKFVSLPTLPVAFRFCGLMDR